MPSVHMLSAGLVQVMYGVCTIGDFTLIYKELKSIQLRTLNRVRAEMLFTHHLTHGRVRLLLYLSSPAHRVGQRLPL